jgi:hypothetical protein
MSLGHQYVLSLSGTAGPDEALQRYVRAAQCSRLCTLSGPPSAGELHDELLELSELEGAAALAAETADAWVQDLLDEEGFAHGFLGLDEP